MITYEFQASVNGGCCGGSFEVEARNFKIAQRRADDKIARYLATAPGSLTFGFYTECVKSNADELLEKDLKNAIAMYGEDHVDLVYADGVISVMYHSSKNSFSIVSFDEDEFCFENNNYADPMHLVEDLATNYSVGYSC